MSCSFIFLNWDVCDPNDSNDHISTGAPKLSIGTTPKDVELQVLATTSYNLQRSIEIMDAGGLILSDSDARECSNCLHMYLTSWHWLAAHFQQKRLMLCLVRPKHHCIHHHAEQLAQWKVNQRLFQTMDEESFLGKLKHIFVACHGKTASSRMYSRYLLVLTMVLENHRRFEEDLG